MIVETSQPQQHLAGFHGGRVRCNFLTPLKKTYIRTCIS